MDDMNGRDSPSRARTAASPPEPAYERLPQRRDRKRRQARVASAVTAAVVAVAAVTGAVLAFGLHGTGNGQAPHEPAASGTGPNLVAGPGPDYHMKDRPPQAWGHLGAGVWG